MGHGRNIYIYLYVCVCVCIKPFTAEFPYAISLTKYAKRADTKVHYGSHFEENV